MTPPYQLRCVLCGRQHPPAEVAYTCPPCGVRGVCEIIYDYDRLRPLVTPARFPDRSELSLWRYRALLPVAPDTPPTPLQAGWTPLYPAPRLRERLGLGNLWVKDDGRNPTASLKDRASAVAIVKAQELGATVVTCASTGNAAASWAGVAAPLGLRCVVFVPKTAPRGKVAQLLTYGATVFAVDGSYDDAFDLAQMASERFGWYNRNTAVNPYTIEGKKTVALEIAEQLGWRAPDTVIVSVGDGCIISGVWKGFVDLHALGLIDRLPRLIAAQATTSNAILQALEGDGQIRPVLATTRADGINVGLPRNGVMAVKAIRASGGRAVAVSDAEMFAAMKLLARTTGVFTELAGAASVAVLEKLAARGALAPDETVVVINTGNGLKDPEAALAAGGSPIAVPPDLEAVAAALGE